MTQLVEVSSNQAVTSSRMVAKVFEKKHQHVLRDIDDIKKSGGVQNWTDLFYETTYIHEQNKQEYRMYLMNRDGFSLLAMGFTGKKALEWKLKYIDAFNKMEKTIEEQQKQIADLTKHNNAQARLKNANARQAKLLMQIAESAAVPIEYKGVLSSKAVEIMTGEQLLPLPKVEEKTYTATEIARELGTTPNMVGRVANQHNLKTDEYGIEVWDKSPYSAKQVPSWRYNDKGRKELFDIFQKEVN